MLFLGTGLLKEYILANDTLKLMTGGSKCKWNPKNERIKFSKKPYVICLILGLLFGQGEIITTVRTLVQGKSRSIQETDELKKFSAVGTILACGKVIAYFSVYPCLKYCKTHENFFNNLISMENRSQEKDQSKSQPINTTYSAIYN